MKKLTLGIVLMLAPVTAGAVASTQETPGFTPDDMANFAREARQDGQIKAARTLFAETETLRAAFVINPTRTFAALTANERQILQRTADPESELRMLALHWFMRGGIAKASIVDGAMLSGIYHPVADVWLVIRWDRRGGGWRVADAALVPAATLDARPADMAADPVGSYRRATDGFARLTQEYAVPTILGARVGDRATAKSAAFARIDAAIGTLGRWYGEAPQARALARLVAGFGAPDSAALALPSAARATLAPVAATNNARGVTLWLSSPLSPTTLIAADWPGGDFGKRPSVRAVALDRPRTAALAQGAVR